MMGLKTYRKRFLPGEAVKAPEERGSMEWSQQKET